MTTNQSNTKKHLRFPFSQSSLQDYSDCPRRFQLRYIERLAWPAVESEPVLEHERRQREGQLYHRMIQQRLLGIPAEKLRHFAQTANMVKWWQSYMDKHPGLSGYTLYPELSLSTPIGNQRLLAKYDLIAIKPGEKALILEWKTYQKRPREEWLAARWQTRLYRALLVEAGKHINQNQPLSAEQVEMVYWFADFPTEPARFPYSTAFSKRDWEALAKIVGEITSTKEFPLTDDENKCRFCTYRSYCARGTRAGSLVEIEAEAEAETWFDVNFEQVQEIEF